MSTIRLVKQHPGVLDATTRLRYKESALRRAEEQIKELQRKRSQAKESAIEAEVSASIDDGSPEGVVQAEQAAHAAAVAAAVVETEQEVERRRVAVRLLQGKLREAEGRATIEVGEALRSALSAAMCLLTSSITDAECALKAVQNLEGLFAQNGIESPSPSLNLGQNTNGVGFIHGGNISMTATQFLERAARDGFRVAQTKDEA